MKKWIFFTLCILISLGCLLFAFSKVEWDSFFSYIKYFDFSIVILAVCVYLIGFIPRAFRWQLMLYEVSRISFLNSWKMILLGYSTNNILPFRLGEFVRAEFAGREMGISRLTCLSSIIAERILDGLIIVFYLMLSAFFLFSGTSSLSEDVSRVFVLGISIFAFATLVIFALSIFSNQLTQIIHRIFGDRISTLADNYFQALVFFKDYKKLVLVMILSFFVWAIEATMFVLLLRSLSITNALAVGFYCMAMVNLGILVPSAPGFVGVFQAATVLAFMSLGLNADAGLAFSVVLHMAQFIPVTLIGVVILARMGFGFSSLLHVSQESN